jgi:hypothetical protein
MESGKDYKALIWLIISILAALIAIAGLLLT